MYGKRYFEILTVTVKRYFFSRDTVTQRKLRRYFGKNSSRLGYFRKWNLKNFLRRPQPWWGLQIQSYQAKKCNKTRLSIKIKTTCKMQVRKSTGSVFRQNLYGITGILGKFNGITGIQNLVRPPHGSLILLQFALLGKDRLAISSVLIIYLCGAHTCFNGVRVMGGILDSRPPDQGATSNRHLRNIRPGSCRLISHFHMTCWFAWLRPSSMFRKLEKVVKNSSEFEKLT